MIRDAVIHLTGKLPVVADLPRVPAPSDVSLLACNVRTRDGKRPTFVDNPDAWFLIPLREVSVIELPADALDEPVAATPVAVPAPASAPANGALDELEAGPDTSPLEPDEDLLARIRQF